MVLSPEQQVKVAFGRYQWLAWVTGTVLAFNVVVALPYKYLLHGSSHWTMYAWMGHGWLYLIYFIVTLDLALKAKWSMPRAIGYLVAGTIPFASFFAERRLRAELL